MAGRPRDPDIDEAIIRSVYELIEKGGYKSLSMEGIAAHAGVAKQALYRRFHDKGHVLLGALTRFAAEQLPRPDTGSLREDLAVLLRATFREQRSTSGALNRAMAIEALQDEEIGALVWNKLIDARRQTVREMFVRARERGEIANRNDDKLLDLVYGPMWYRLLFGREVLDDDYADWIVNTVMSAAGADDGPSSGENVAPGPPTA